MVTTYATGSTFGVLNGSGIWDSAFFAHGFAIQNLCDC